MIFWLVLELEISYKSYNNLKRFWVFFLEDFWKMIFLDGEIFESP
jgi:hypothetical protein